MKTTITAANAVAIASLVNYADNSKIPITPTLAAVHVTIKDNTLTAIATDRYVMAKFSTVLDVTDGRPSEFRISAAAAKWILANVKKGNKWNTPAPVSLEIDGDNLTITTKETAYTSQLVAGISPKVESLLNLFDEWQPAETAQTLSLGSKFLTKITKLLDDFSRVEFATYELGKAMNGSDKPGPVKVTAGAFEILIQPRVMPTN